MCLRYINSYSTRKIRVFAKPFIRKVMKTCVIVFAKNPVPNQVKTRLIPTLTPEHAAILYTAFLTDWCEILAKLSGVDLIVAYTPIDAESDLQALIGEDATYIPQTGTDLGERLDFSNAVGS